jgi:hypothetical protein
LIDGSAIVQAGDARPAKPGPMNASTIATLVLWIGAIVAPVATTPTVDACAAYPNKMGICNEHLARWLPPDTDAFDSWRRGFARLKTPSDPFVFGRNGKAVEFPAGSGLEHSSEDGMSMGVDAVDLVHHIVFVHTACCGADYRVLGRTEGPPPLRLPAADLSRVQTRSGIRLGMRASEVIARLGWTRMYRTPGRPGMTFLGYTSDEKPATALNAVSDVGEHCPDAMLVALRDDRIVSIVLEHSC